MQRHVTRVADVKEDALEALYEKRLKKKTLQKEKVESGLQVDPVDALPVKTLDGKLYYRTCIILFLFVPILFVCAFVHILPISMKELQYSNECDWFVSSHDAVQKTSILCANSDEETGEDEKDASVDKSIVKLTKVERRAKLKKQKKEAKKQGKELDKAEEVQQTPQAAVLVLFQFFYYLKIFLLFFSFCFVLLKNEENFILKEESPLEKMLGV